MKTKLLIILSITNFLYLDNVNPWFESRTKLIENFGDELLVLQYFSHFHNPYNCSLNQKLTILLYVFVGSFLFDLKFRLHGNIDIDSQFFAAKSHKKK